MRRQILCALWAVVLLGGCTLAPKYERPEAPVPDTWPADAAYRVEAMTDSGARSVPEIPWRKFFIDEALQQVIAAALECNRDLRLAALRVQRARAIYGIQRSALYPALDATADVSKQRIPADISSTGRSRTTEQWEVDLGVFAWEIDFFGHIRSLKDQALETYLATEQARRGTQILIVSAVADAYLSLAADLENLELAQKTLETQQEAYQMIQRRYKVGLASELDVHRAQTQVDVARRDIALYTQLAAQDQNALNLLVGAQPPLTSDVLPTGLAGVKPFKEISAGLSSEILLARPDILQAESLLKAANANIGAARSALFPRISLTTMIGTASNDLSGLFGSDSGTWLFAPHAAMPVFDARLWSALDATKAEREIAVVEYEKAIQTAFREVADTLVAQGTLDARLAAQESLVNAAAQTYRLAHARYAQGIDSYLGVLDAQRSLFAAQQGLVALRLAKRANQVQLYAVLGGGGQ